MLELVRRRPLALKGARLPWPRLVALRRDTLAVVEGRDLLLVFGGADRDELRTRHVQVLGWAPARAHVSATGKYLLLESSRGNYVQVIDADTGRRAAELVAPDVVRFGLAKIGNDDLVICSRTLGVLEGLRLPSLEVVFRADCSKPTPFAFDRLEVMADLRSLAIVGHVWLEPYDTLHLMELSELTGDPEHLPAVLEQPAPVTGETLFLGVAAGDDVPVLSQSDDPCALDRLFIAPFAGGELVELPPLIRAEDPSPSLLLGPRALLVGRAGSISIVPRGSEGGAEGVSTITSRVHGADRAGGRLLHWPGEGALELVELT